MNFFSTGIRRASKQSENEYRKPDSASSSTSSLQQSQSQPKDSALMSISGVLNDPKLQKITKFDTSLPSIPAIQIRKVRQNEFEPYLKSIAGYYERYQYHRMVGLAAVTQGTPTLGKSADDTPSASLQHLLELVNRTSPTGTASGTAPPTKNLEPDPLDSIPSIFFDPEFNLENPRIFELVTESADVTVSNSQESSNSTSSTTTNVILQEKLSHYLDTIEVHLIREISRRSNSFFATLSNLQQLHSETSACVNKIHDLRKKLADMSKTHSQQGLEVVRLKRRRANLGVLCNGVRLVSEVRQAQPMIQVLLNQGDYIGALDLLSEANRILKGSSSDNQSGQDKSLSSSPQNQGMISRTRLDLRGARALVHFSSQLAETSRTIGMLMENDLMQIFLADLRETLSALNSERASKLLGWVESMLAIKVTGTPTTPTTSWVNSVVLAKEEKLKSRLTSLVLGLLRIDRLSHALQTYKENVLREIKGLIKKHLPPLPPNAGADAKDIAAKKKEQSNILAKQLKTMSFDNFLNLVVSVYMDLLELLKRVAVSHGLITEILNEAEAQGIGAGRDRIVITQASLTEIPTPNYKPGADDDDDDLGNVDVKISSDSTSSTDKKRTFQFPEQTTQPSSPLSPSSPKMPATYTQLIAESADVLYAAADLAHVRCAKLVGVRTEQNAQLNPKDFYRLFGITWGFVVEGESLCGRMGFGLRGTVLSQAKAFINHFHMEKMKQIALLIENEQWIQAEVPVDFQTIVDRIVAAATIEGFNIEDENATIPSQLSRPVSISSDELNIDRSSQESQERINFYSTNPTSMSSISSGGSSKYLVVGNNKFQVVGFVLMFVKMGIEYLTCVVRIPSLTTDVLQKLAELFKVINSRVCQVILGAGAMQSAGLKNITAKHLALASQSLGLVMDLIPHVKSTLRQHLNMKQSILLNEFDKIAKDYLDHQSEIHTKLVSIMGERLNVHCRTLQTTNWDVPDKNATGTDPAPSQYMEQLVKETTTLHKVLSKYIPPDTLKGILMEVFKNYNKRLEEELKKLDIYTSTGKNRLLIDVQFFIQRLSNLDGVDGPGNHLEVVVNNIKIKEKRVAPPPSAVNPPPPEPKQATSSFGTAFNFKNLMSSTNKGPTIGNVSTSTISQTLPAPNQSDGSSSDSATASTASLPPASVGPASGATSSQPASTTQAGIAGGNTSAAAQKTKQMATDFFKKMNWKAGE